MAGSMKPLFKHFFQLPVFTLLINRRQLPKIACLKQFNAAAGKSYAALKSVVYRVTQAMCEEGWALHPAQSEFLSDVEDQ